MSRPAVATSPTPPPGLGAALRSGLADFYYNSWRLVPANVVWGAALLGIIGSAIVSPAALLPGLMLLALPTTGVFHLAARIVRGEPAAFRDALDVHRRAWRRSLALGTAVVAAGTVLSTNVVIGLELGGAVGWSLVTLAAWGLVANLTLAIVIWPLAVDPRREDRPLTELLRLAVAVVLQRPATIGAAAILFLALGAVSAIALAALLTVSVAYVALVAGRLVLPAADRLEALLADGETG